MYEDPSPPTAEVEVGDLLRVSGDFALYAARSGGRPVQLWVGHGPHTRVAFVERSSSWLNQAPKGLLGADQVGHLEDGTPYRLDEEPRGLRPQDLDAPLSEQDIRQIGQALARRLGIAHQQELVHGAICLEGLRLAKTEQGWDAALSDPAPLAVQATAEDDLRDLAVLLLHLKDAEAPAEAASAERFEDPSLRRMLRRCLGEESERRPTPGSSASCSRRAPPSRSGPWSPRAWAWPWSSRACCWSEPLAAVASSAP